MANDNKLVSLLDLKEAYDALYSRDVMDSSDKNKLNGIENNAQVNTITGVKGDGESSYRTGNVNLTPADVGAVAKTGDTMTGNLDITKIAAVVSVMDSQKGHKLQLGSWNDGTQGLWSLGYYNGSAPVSSPIWLIERDTTGKVIVNNHYNKTETDSAIQEATANVAHIQKSNIAAGGSETFTITRPCFVVVGRASVSSNTTSAFVDGWAGIVYLSNNSDFVVTASGDTLTITNNASSYCSCLVICK